MHVIEKFSVVLLFLTSRSLPSPKCFGGWDQGLQSIPCLSFSLLWGSGFYAVPGAWASIWNPGSTNHLLSKPADTHVQADQGLPPARHRPCLGFQEGFTLQAFSLPSNFSAGLSLCCYLKLLKCALFPGPCPGILDQCCISWDLKILKKVANTVCQHAQASF